MSREACVLSKEACVLSREACVLSREACVLSREVEENQVDLCQSLTRQIVAHQDSFKTVLSLYEPTYTNHTGPKVAQVHQKVCKSNVIKGVIVINFKQT